jgi:hypothetical protein
MRGGIGVEFLKLVWGVKNLQKILEKKLFVIFGGQPGTPEVAWWPPEANWRPYKLLIAVGKPCLQFALTHASLHV